MDVIGHGYEVADRHVVFSNRSTEDTSDDGVDLVRWPKEEPRVDGTDGCFVELSRFYATWWISHNVTKYENPL